MQNDEIIIKVNNMLIDCIEVTEEQLDPKANFYKIGKDSLDYVWLFAQIEEKFGFKITTEEIVKVTTLQDFYSYVGKKLSRNN
jgi:acyl carrier protein